MIYLFIFFDKKNLKNKNKKIKVWLKRRHMNVYTLLLASDRL